MGAPVRTQGAAIRQSSVLRIVTPARRARRYSSAVAPAASPARSERRSKRSCRRRSQAPAAALVKVALPPDTPPQIEHSDTSMASNQLTQRYVDRFSLRPSADQLLGFVEHTVIDLDVGPHTLEDTHPRMYFGAKPGRIRQMAGAVKQP